MLNFIYIVVQSLSEVKSLSRVRFFVTPWTVACTRLLCSWNFLGKSTGVGCHFLLQGIFLTQESNPGLLHCRQTLYHLSHQGSPQFYLYRSVAQSCSTLYDPMDGSTLGFPVLHHLLELAQIYVHQVSDAMQSYHLSAPSTPSFNSSQHQGLF